MFETCSTKSSITPIMYVLILYIVTYYNYTKIDLCIFKHTDIYLDMVYLGLKKL